MKQTHKIFLVLLHVVAAAWLSTKHTHTRVGQFQGQSIARIRHWIDRCNKSLLHHPHTKLLPCRWPSIHRYLQPFINRVVWYLHPSIRKNSRCLEEPRRPVDNIVDYDGNLDRRTLVVELVRSAGHKVCFFNLWVIHQGLFELLERKNCAYEGNAVVREKTIKRRGQSWLTPPIPHSSIQAFSLNVYWKWLLDFSPLVQWSGVGSEKPLDLNQAPSMHVGQSLDPTEGQDERTPQHRCNECPTCIWKLKWYQLTWFFTFWGYITW